MAQRILSKDLHSWNPMQNDYEDPNFNTYRDGPGAHLDMDKHLSSSGKSGSKSGPYKLFVGNIPTTLDKEGIENIFCNVGNPIDVFRKNPDSSATRTWAFVTFATYREADGAVRDINQKPPFKLRVEFAKTQESEERIPINIPRKSTTADAQGNLKRGSSFQSESSGKGRGIFVQPFVDPRTTEDGIIGRDSSDMTHFQPYRGSIYDESNTSLMRGVQRATGPRGPQKFVMGRACFDRELDEMVRPNQLKRVGLDVRASLENHVESVNGQFEYGRKINPRPDMQGTCTLCGREATQYCQRCHDWYCSRTCQEQDWHRHRKYCIPPRLVNSKEAEAEADIHLEPERGQRMQVGEGERQQEKGKTPRSNGSCPEAFSSKGREDITRSDGGCDKAAPSRDIRQAKKNGSKVHGNGSRTHVEKAKYGGDQNRPRNSFHSRDQPGKDKFQKTSPEVKNYNQKQPGRRSYDSGSSVLEKMEELSVREDLQKCKIDINDVKERIAEAETGEASSESSAVHHLTEELSETSFTKIKVAIPLGPFEFWAQKVDKFHDIMSMSAELEKHKNSSPVKPIVGAYCMSTYQGMWFRGKITSVKPQIMVFYLDFGNEDPADLKDLRELPKFARRMRAQALKIKLAPGTSDKFKDVSEDQTVSVKLAFIKNESLIVYVEGEEYAEEESSAGMRRDIALQNIMVLLKIDMPCYLFITEYNDPENFTASLVPRNLIDHYNSLFYGKLKDVHEGEQSDKFIPQLGEAILAKFSEGWLRCYVVFVSSPEEYIVASCDTGMVEAVTEIKRMPQKLREIAQFAVHCRALDNNYKARKLINETKKLSVVVQNATCDSALCIVEDEEGGTVCDLEVRKWSPPFELYEELDCIEVKDGLCVVSAYMSAVDVYVRPVTSSCIELYNLLLQDVPKHCFTAQPLDHIPKVGEVLAAQFTEDKNYYRAVVRDVNRTKGVQVQYLDFGNVEYVSPKVLKPLSQKLRSRVCLAVKVKLKDVIENPLTEDSHRYFKDLIVSEKKLTIKLHPNTGNHVSLFESDGSSVNERLNKLLQPDWKKQVDSDTRIFAVEDVTFETLDVGGSFQLVINSVLSYNSLLVTNEASKTFRELKSHLESKMAEYCSVIKDPYTPRERELCLAKSDGVWCRCSCLFGGSMLSLLSLDSGEIKEISHEFIRRMPKDFINLPVSGLFCEVKTSVDCGSEKIQQHMEDYFKIAKVINAKVIGYSNSGFMRGYVVRVQELDDLLASLGFL